MTPQVQQRQWSKRATAPTFVHLPIFLVLISSSLKMASGGTSGSYFASCSAETLACEEDANCNECLSSWPVADSVSTCEEYPTESTTSDSTCREDGAENCCGFESGTAETCMQDPLLEAFWACTLEDIGCALIDMPCSTAGVAASAEDAREEEATEEDSAASSPVGHASSLLLLSAAGAGLVASIVTAGLSSFSLA